MRVVFFSHSVLSDWNHGNAHFLRGVSCELQSRGHSVRIFEPYDSWSVQNLVRDHGAAALQDVRRVYPSLNVTRYHLSRIDLDQALDSADLVIVHEWNEPELVAAIGARRARGARFRLLFHDTHHRSMTAPSVMGRFDLSGYDGVLAFGEAIREVYLSAGWADKVWTWHEAADVRIFRPLPSVDRDTDLVWVGNWGDEERTHELHEFLLEPVRDLRLSATVHGVRYPPGARKALAGAGIRYGGWLPNYRVPELFARHRVTIHVPRRPYVTSLPGIPTIRVFEALACGIPLVSAPWADVEHLFSPGTDFLVAQNGAEMRRHLRDILQDSALSRALAHQGRQTILARHTCSHRVDELLAISRSIGATSGTFPAVGHQASLQYGWQH